MQFSIFGTDFGIYDDMKKGITLQLLIFSAIGSLVGYSEINLSIDRFKACLKIEGRCLNNEAIEKLYNACKIRTCQNMNVSFGAQKELYNNFTLTMDHDKKIIKADETGCFDVFFNPKDSPVLLKDSVFAPSNKDSLQVSSLIRAEVENSAQSRPILTFTDTVYNFGVITDAKPVRYTFRFRNTGNDYLTITRATGTCGCVQVDFYSKEPMAPGEIGHITISINPSATKAEEIEKYIYVFSNAGDKKLKVIGTIKAIQR
jgi:hypothetical protein